MIILKKCLARNLNIPGSKSCSSRLEICVKYGVRYFTLFRIFISYQDLSHKQNILHNRFLISPHLYIAVNLSQVTKSWTLTFTMMATIPLIMTRNWKTSVQMTALKPPWKQDLNMIHLSCNQNTFNYEIYLRFYISSFINKLTFPLVWQN